MSLRRPTSNQHSTVGQFHGRPLGLDAFLELGRNCPGFRRPLAYYCPHCLLQSSHRKRAAIRWRVWLRLRGNFIRFLWFRLSFPFSKSESTRTAGTRGSQGYYQESLTLGRRERAIEATGYSLQRVALRRVLGFLACHLGVSAQHWVCQARVANAANAGPTALDHLPPLEQLCQRDAVHGAAARTFAP